MRCLFLRIRDKKIVLFWDTLQRETFAGRKSRLFAFSGHFRESISHAKCVLRKRRPIILQKMPITNEKNRKILFENPQIKSFFHAKPVAIHKIKSLKFGVLFFSRKFLPVKVSPRKVYFWPKMVNLDHKIANKLIEMKQVHS